MSIQKQIDDQIKDKKFPRVNITIKNESGDFKLPKGARITLINCDSRCTEAEGDNQIDFVDCQSCGAKGIKNSVLRFTRSSEIEQIEAEDSKVHFGDAQVEKLELTRCETAYLNSEIQTAEFEDCKIESLKNQYSELTIKGGRINSHNDQFEQLSIEGKSNGAFFQAEVEQLSIEESNATFIEGKTEQAEITDGCITDLKGSYDELTVSGDKSSCSLNGTKISGEASFTDATVLVEDSEFEGEVSLQSSPFIGKKVKFQGEFSVQEKEAILVDCELQEATFENALVRVCESSLQGEVSITESTFESSDSEYQSEVSVSEGNFTSRRDKFSQKLTMEEAVGSNLLAEATGLLKLEFTGGGIAKLELIEVEAQDIDISEVGILYAAKCDAQKFSLEAFTHAILDECTFQIATIEEGPFLNAATSELQLATIKEVQHAITRDLQSAIVQNSGLIDDGSTIAAEDSFIQARGSDVTSVGCLINTLGGSVIGTDKTIVITKGANVTNPDGLTIGEGFQPDLSGASLKFDGLDLTLQCTLGNVDIISRAGDITLTADAGNILGNAALNVEIGAGVDIIGLAGVTISLDSLVDVDITAGANVTINSDGDVTIQGVGATFLASEATVTIGAPSINALGVSQFLGV